MLRRSLRSVILCLSTLVSQLPTSLDAEEHAIEQLVYALAHGTPSAKAQAASSLAYKPRHAKQVITLLARALEDERPEREIDPMSTAISPHVWSVAAHVESALVAFGKESVPTVIRLLEHKDENIRFRAAQILQNIGEPAAASATQLVAGLRKERKEDLRFQYLSAYGIVENNLARLQQTLLFAMNDTSPSVREVAIQICGRRRLTDPRLVQKIGETLRDVRSKSPLAVSVHYSAEALGQIGDAARGWLPQLNKLVESSGGEGLAAAYAVLRIQGQDRRAMERLFEAASNADQEVGVAIQATRLIAQLGPELRPNAARALPVLAACCRHQSDEQYGMDGMVRYYAREAAVAICGSDALPLLRASLKSADALDRQHAAKAILSLGPARRIAVPDLIEALSDTRGPLNGLGRTAAAEALGEFGYSAKAAIPALQKMARADYGEWEASLAGVAKEALAKINQAATASRFIQEPRNNQHGGRLLRAPRRLFPGRCFRPSPFRRPLRRGRAAMTCW